MKTKFHAKSFLTRECERYQSLSKKEKEKKNKLVSDIKISLKMKKNDCFSTEKNIVK